MSECEYADTLPVMYTPDVVINGLSVRWMCSHCGQVHQLIMQAEPASADDQPGAEA